MHQKPITYLLVVLFLFTLTHVSAQDEKAAKKIANKSAGEAKKSYKKNDYLDALRFGIQALQGPISKKKRENTVEIASKSYKKLVTGNLMKIEELSIAHETYSSEATVFGRKDIVNRYDKIIKGINSTRRAGASIIKEINVDPSSLVDYTPQKEEAEVAYQTAVDLYVDEQYALANENMAEDLKPQYRKAYYNFENIKKYKTAFKDSESLQAVALEKATYTLAVFSFSNKTGNPNLSSKEYSLATYLANQLKTNRGDYIFLDVKPVVTTSQAIQQTTTTSTQPDAGTILGNALLGRETKASTQTTTTTTVSASRYPTPEELKQYDLVIYGSFFNPSTSISEVTMTKKERSKTVGKDENKRTVKATLFSYEQVQNAEITGELFVYNSLTETHIIDQKVMKGVFSNVLRWAKATGNEKALKKSDKSKIKPRPAPQSDDILLAKALDNCLTYAEPAFRAAFKYL